MVVVNRWIAYECDNDKGLHIAEERVIVETNENNELIITDLDNYVNAIYKILEC